MSKLVSGNVVVLIDAFTRKSVDSITYDVLSKHATVITDIRELTDSQYGCELVFFEPSVPAIVTPEILTQMVGMYNIHPHFVYTIDELGVMMGALAHSVKAVYHEIDWNLVYAVVHSDNAILEQYQHISQCKVEFASTVEALPPECVAPVNRMFTSYVELAGAFGRVVSENSRLSETVNNYRSVGKKTIAAIEELQSLLREANEKNRTYCAMLSESYDVMFSGVYPERPRVLYIKSISHLSGIDSLIMTLYSVVTKQNRYGCKVVKLVDSSSANIVRYIPNVYVPLTDSYSTSDVLTNDFLVSLGGYNLLMSLLMLNRSKLEVLIVHDMRGTLNDALDSSLYDLKVNEVSGDYAVLNEYPNTLSDVDSAQYVWKFADVKQYTGAKAIRLTNHPVVSSILDYLI